MAEAFLGMRMTVVLKSGYSVTGMIAHIVPNEMLVLQKAYFSTGAYSELFKIDPNDIEDVVDSSRSTAHSHPEPVAPTFTAPVAIPVPAPSLPENGSTFQDPAILSITRRPTQPTQPPSSAGRREVLAPIHTGNGFDSPTTAIDPVKRLEEELKMATPSIVTPKRLEKEPNMVTPSTDPVKRLEEELKRAKMAPPEQTAGPDIADGNQQNATQTGPSAQSKGKSSRGQRRKNKTRAGRSADGDATPTSSTKGVAEQGSGSGWRQTPILQQSSKSFQPFNSLKKSQKPNADGWASEDVTDVQEAGDFDFEGNLTKFDKRTIFDEMRQQDKVDESERLVSHNRLPRPKPGTAGGKNLHFTENVLDMDKPSSSAAPAGLAARLKETPDDFWKSEADDTTINNGGAGGGERHNSGREGSGRSSRLRGESRLSTSRRSQSRKASGAHSVAGGPSRANSNQLGSGDAEGFYAVPSNRRIETVTYLQMLNLENIAHNEMGLVEDLMAENAGRSISEVALSTLSDPAVVLFNAANTPTNTTTIVVLAGNNKSSVRAISAARHLRNRGINVLVCVVGIEREKDLIEEVQKQTRLYRNFGGIVCSKAQLFKHLSKAATTLKSSPQVAVTLIIDALLGLSISFEELRKSDQATTYELMEWANRNDAFVMAIDIPSGVDPTSGKVNVIDGAKLYVHPRYVVALGAPKQGLLRAMQIGRAEDGQVDVVEVDDWKLYLADIGLGASIWRKAAANVRLRKGIDFDDKWVLPMRYHSLGDES